MSRAPASGLSDLSNHRHAETRISLQSAAVSARNSAITVATALGALFFIVQFILAAIAWISAGGDSGKIEKARNNMMNGAMGLIILVSAYAAIGLIGNVLRIDILNFGQQISNIIPN